MPENLTGAWNFPTRILHGPGRMAELASVCRARGLERPLIVTDEGLVDLPVMSRVRKVMTAADYAVAVFSDVRGNPTLENVDKGHEVYRAGGHDGIVAIGGGSALDVGKCIAMMAQSDMSLWDMADRSAPASIGRPGALAPVIAVPTAPGTGAEASAAAVITNRATHEKKTISHAGMMPCVVIADPELSAGLPAFLTAATGFDALSHCIEAYCSPSFHPMADGIALQGIALIARYLPRASARGGDLEARSRMLAASIMGATAFQKGLGAVHAISHQVSAIYNTHHGLTNAVLLPYVLAYNRPDIEPKIAILARVLELETRHADDGFDRVIGWLLDLREEMGIPHVLSELGVETSMISRLAHQAMQDPCAACNPRRLSETDFADVISAAITGDLAVAA